MIHNIRYLTSEPNRQYLLTLCGLRTIVVQTAQGVYLETNAVMKFHDTTGVLLNPQTSDSLNIFY